MSSSSRLPINSRLGKSVGSIEAATFSFLVGTAALVLILLVTRGGIGGLVHVDRAPWWALVGGLLGAVYVSVALVASFCVESLRNRRTS